MFGLSKKKASDKKVKKVAKKEVKIEKQQNAFDDWVKKHKKLILIENKSSIKKIYWFKEFEEFIKNGGDVEEFLKIKNERLFLEFKEDLNESMADRNERLCDEIRKCENVKVCADKLDQLLYEFDRDVKILVKKFKPKFVDDVKELLFLYSQNGQFDEAILEKLRVKTKGFWDTLFNWCKVYKAKKFLNKFVEYYIENNVFRKANEIFFMHYGKDVGYALSLRIDTIIMFDEETTKIWIKKKEKALNKNQKIIKDLAKIVAQNGEILENEIKSFYDTKLLEKERDIVVKILKKINDVG